MMDTAFGVESDSEDEQEIQFEILEKERDDANQKLMKIEHVSQQLLKEIDALEIQFQMERSCRENAEAFAIKVTKENKALKRRSQALLPLISELPDNLDLNCNTGPDLGDDPDLDTSADPVIQYQEKIKDMQGSLDQLLEEKMQLLEQLEVLKREQVELKEQLVLEIEERESVLRRLNKQDRTMQKMKRVSQLVSQEFNDISQRLELEQGLRQHAEVFAHQMLVQQKEMQRQSVVMSQNTELGPQLQQALMQVAQINRILEDIHLCYPNLNLQVQPTQEEGNASSELQNIQDQLMKSEAERRALEAQLRDAQGTVTQLQEEVQLLERKLKESTELSETAAQKEPVSTPGPSLPPPPPPPPPPLPPSKRDVDPLDALRNRKASTGNDKLKASGSPSTQDMKARAVTEMMERIKRGIVLRPTQKSQVGSEDDSAWKVEQNEKRKSAVMELQSMLDSLNRQSHWRAGSRKQISRQVGEAELQAVLLRRRRVMGDEQEQAALAPTQGQKSVSTTNSSLLWANEAGSTPVLRRLKQNRENRNSRVRASGCVIWEES